MASTATRRPHPEPDVERPGTVTVRTATQAIKRALERQAGLDNDRIDQARNRLEESRRSGH